MGFLFPQDRGFRRGRAVVLAVVFGLAPSLYSQSIGRIGGIVSDSSGAVIPGATVVCKQADTALVRTVQTNQSGNFQFPDLPIGSYSIEASKEGFQSQQADKINLLTGQSVGFESDVRCRRGGAERAGYGIRSFDSDGYIRGPDLGGSKANAGFAIERAKPSTVNYTDSWSGDYGRRHRIGTAG